MLLLSPPAFVAAVCCGLWLLVHAKLPCDPNGNALKQELEEAAGIHSLDICQLAVSFVTKTNEKLSRPCTAALVLVDGHAMVVTAATCFAPSPAETNFASFKKTSTQGLSFSGKLTLTCGPDNEKLEIQATFDNKKALVHPMFDVKAQLYIDKNNLAVVRVGEDDYAKIPKDNKPNWLFTRTSSAKKTTGPTEETSCRCYAPRDAAHAEPREFKAERCPTTKRVKNLFFTDGSTCFVVYKDQNDHTEFNDLAKKADGYLQTMACFCKPKAGPTVSSLRSLHSVGFYRMPKQADDAIDLYFHGVPIGPNWSFLLGANDATDTPLGASDQQMETLKSKAAKAEEECLLKWHDDISGSSLQKLICDHSDAKKVEVRGKTKKWTVNIDRFRTAMAECVAKHPDLAIMTPKTGLPLALPPLAEIMDAMMNGLDREKLCPNDKSKSSAGPGFTEALLQQTQCFGLLLRSNFKMRILTGPERSAQVFRKSGGAVGVFIHDTWLSPGDHECDNPLCAFVAYLGTAAFCLAGVVGVGVVGTIDAAAGAVGAVAGTVAHVVANKID